MHTAAHTLYPHVAILNIFATETPIIQHTFRCADMFNCSDESVSTEYDDANSDNDF